MVRDMTSYCRCRVFCASLQVILTMLIGAFGLVPSASSADLAGNIEREILEPLAGDAPGAAAVLVLGGEVVSMRTWGVRDTRSDRTPIDHQTLFRVASISKTFAGTAGALLVREVDVDWQTPITSQIDGLRFKKNEWGERINLQHVLSQGTGLMPHAYTNLIEDNQSFERILGKLHKVDFICAPGECYSYQNVVFSLVGEVVEEKTGLPYSRFVEERIFQPLGMQRASIGYREYIDDANHARPHIWTGETWASTRVTREYYHVPPAAGVNASIDDMRRWLLAQLGRVPEVLPVTVLDEVQSGVQATSRKKSHYPRNPKLGDVHYGLGWRIFEYDGVAGFVHHGGYVRGMRSEMVFNREIGAGLVYLTNSEPNKLGRIVFEFADHLLAARPASQALAAAD